MMRLGKWFGFAPDEVFDEAMALFDRGDFEDAIEAFEECLADDPEPSVLRLARFYLAESHAQLGRSALNHLLAETALAHFEAALGLFPNYPDLNLGAARSCHAMRQPGRALEFIKHALRANDACVESILLESVLDYELAKDELAGDCALARAADAIRIEPSLGWACLELAMACHAQGDRGQALQHLSQLAAAASGDASIHADVAASYMREKQYGSAAEAFRKAVARSPHLAELRCRFGQALLGAKMPAEAVKQLSHAIRLDPTSAEAYAHLGLAQRALGQESEAVASFQRAHDLNPDYPVGMAALGNGFGRGYAL